MNSMLNEYTESVRASAKERLTSPLLGSFTIIFLATNYKLLFIIFGSATAQEKINLAANQFDSGKGAFLHLVLPVLLTGLFVWLYPFISNLIHSHWLNCKKKQINKERVAGAELTKKMSDEELQIFQRTLFDDEYHFNQILEDKNVQIDSYKKDNSQLNEEVTVLTQKNEKLQMQLTKEQYSLLPFGFEIDSHGNIVTKSASGGSTYYCPICISKKIITPLSGNKCRICGK
ncbi:MAG: hypothetical protein L3J71_00265 [Victivallaceae bacterium]|nr:hypothetical protein [Victivallaceae bacterium]